MSPPPMLTSVLGALQHAHDTYGRLEAAEEEIARLTTENADLLEELQATRAKLQAIDGTHDGTTT